MGLCHSEEKKIDARNRRSNIIPIDKTRDIQEYRKETDVRKEVDQIFDKYDLNRDGVLEKEEARQMIQDMQRDRNPRASWGPLENYVSSFMDKADTKRKGVIDRNDFYNFYKQK